MSQSFSNEPFDLGQTVCCNFRTVKRAKSVGRKGGSMWKLVLSINLPIGH